MNHMPFVCLLWADGYFKKTFPHLELVPFGRGGSLTVISGAKTTTGRVWHLESYGVIWFPQRKNRSICFGVTMFSQRRWTQATRARMIKINPNYILTQSTCKNKNMKSILLKYLCWCAHKRFQCYNRETSCFDGKKNPTVFLISAPNAVVSSSSGQA